MSAAEVLDRSHALVLETLDNLPELAWDIPHVDGNWSVKEVVAHLSAYESLLLDLLKTFSGEEAGPALLSYARNKAQFDEDEVAKRRYETAQHIEDEYNDLQVQTTSLLQQLPAEKVNQKGAVPWFGPDLSLADVIDQFEAHTRKHCQQIKRFRQQSQDF